MMGLPELKIGRIETFLVPPRWLFVRVETVDGAHGWGEASLEGHAEAVNGAFEAIRDRFIGHVERCAVLLHLVDGTQPDPAGAYETVRAELAGYGNGLADKPEIVALNKADAMTAQARTSRVRALSRAAGQPVLLISGATGEGVPEILHALARMIAAARAG